MLTTGTSAGYVDLLNDVATWLTGTVGWDEIDNSGISPLPWTLVLRAPGSLAGHEYYVTFSTEEDVGAGHYGWNMHAHSDYDADLPVASQTNASPVVYFNTWENSIDWWAYANDRRLVLVAKVNTSYVSLYLGCFNPFAIPTEYPKPFYIGGNYVQLDNYDEPNTRNRMIADPGHLTAFFLTPTDGWREVSNHGSNTTAVALDGGPDAIMWPHRSCFSSDFSFTSNSGWGTDGMFLLRPNLAGEMPNFLCHIIDLEDMQAVGSLEGVYSAGGFSRVSEQVITVAGDDYTLFQNVFRTTARDFMAIEEA